MICPACSFSVERLLHADFGGVCLACWIEGRVPMAVALLKIAEDFDFEVEVIYAQLRGPKP